jgi:hypothetical protein
MRLGDLLVKRGVLSEAQRDSVVETQKLTGRPFGELAERLFGISQASVEEAWAEQYAMIARRVDPRVESVDVDVLELLGRRQAWQFRMLPLRFEADELLICTTQDHLPRAMKFAGWKIKAACFFVISDPFALGEALMRHYRMDGMTASMVAGKRLEIA